MKKVKIALSVFWAAVLIGSFFFSTAHAQGVDYTIWEGAWFKITIAVKGYERNLAGTPDWLPENGKVTGFVNIGTWNDPNGSIESDETFDVVIYFLNDTGWQNKPGILNRIHGNPLDMLIWSQTDTGNIAAGNGERNAFLARITGKMDRTGTFLQTGTFKTFAGLLVEVYPPSDPDGPLYHGSALTMTGNLIIPATFCKSTKNQQYPPCWP